VIKIEVAGLELHGRHGVLAEERERGQRFLFDVELDVGDELAAVTDRIEDAVDYREVVAVVREVSAARDYRLLEALAVAVVEALLARLPAAERVRVRVRKPDVRLDAPVQHTAVTAERARS
jgi:7,8-dihydroneopterin aldolase/epimerase/oxygenase